ncbi:UNVERIFIED_CONTAM: hypothetical protein RMT77_013947 [Armadillidium vulgare]
MRNFYVLVITVYIFFDRSFCNKENEMNYKRNETLNIDSMSTSLVFNLINNNNSNELSQHTEERNTTSDKPPSGGGTSSVQRSEGLSMTIFNQRNMNVTFTKVFPLQNFWTEWKNLIWYTQNIPCGRIVVFGIIGEDTASGIRDASVYFASQGSLFSPLLLTETNWLLIFVKCGKILYEGSAFYYLPTFRMSVNFKAYKDLIEPKNQIERERIKFCNENEILGKLCDEFEPLQIPIKPKIKISFDNLKLIPIIICAGSRLPYFFYTLKTLLETPGVQEDNIEVILGGSKKSYETFLNILKIKYKIIKLEGEGNAMLFQYYRQVYQHVYQNYPSSPAAIFLDEDVKVSPDFFSYMNQTIPILKKDPTIYCVNSYSTTRGSFLYADPSKLMRSESQVSWGYAVPLDFIKEAIFHWPTNSSIQALFDHWLRLNIAKGRHCIYPEQSRSLHIGIDGTNTDKTEDEEIFMQRLTLVQKTGVKLTNIEKVLNYSQFLYNEVKMSVVIAGNPCSENFLLNKTGIFSFFYLMENFTKEGGGLNFQLTGLCLGIWAYSTMGLYDGVFTVRPTSSATIYAVAVPMSKFSYLKPPDTPLWDYNLLNDTEKIETYVFKSRFSIQENQKVFYGDRKKSKNLLSSLFQS